MGASCSKAPQSSEERVQDISILVEQINIGEGIKSRLLKKTLQRNAQTLKRRIEMYEAKLNELGLFDPRIETYKAEHARLTQLLKTVYRMQAVIKNMS
jgi:cytidylate kinase